MVSIFNSIDVKCKIFIVSKNSIKFDLCTYHICNFSDLDHHFNSYETTEEELPTALIDIEFLIKAYLDGTNKS